MKAIILNGWGQVHDSLSDALPASFDDIAHINYAAFSGWDALLKTLPKKQKTDLLIGWSLGGQIACRLVEEGRISAKLLVLLATPFQFVADEKLMHAMHPFMFQAFKTSFQMIPADTLKRFAIMIAEHDSNMKQIVRDLGIDRDAGHKWLEWLDYIGDYSCYDINFSRFPRTLIIHGGQDAIVDARQATIFKDALPNARLEIFADCGHAPHLHDPKLVKFLIGREFKKINAG